MRTAGRIFAGVLIALLVLLVLAVGVIYWAGSTASGTRWAVERITNEELSVAEVEGRLIGPLLLHGVEYSLDDGVVRVDRVGVEWRPVALLRRRVHITALDARGVSVLLPETVDDPEEVEPPHIEIPIVDLYVDRAQVRDLRVGPADEVDPLVIDEVRLTAAVTDGSDVAIEDLVVEAPESRARVAGALTTAGDFPVDLRVRWETEIPDQFRVAGEGELTGSLSELRVDQRLSAPTEVRIQAEVSDALDLGVMRWEADVEVPPFQLGVIREDLEPNVLGFRASLAGDLERVGGSADISGWVEQVGDIVGDARFDYADHEVQLEALELRFPEMNGAGLRVQGGAAVGEDPVRLDLSGDWNDFALPDAPVEIPEGRFAIAGTPQRYDVEAQGTLAGDLLPEETGDLVEADWMARGQGTDSAMGIRVLVEALEGEIEGEVSLAWAPELDWDFSFEGAGLDLGALLPEWGSDLSVGIASRGGIRNGALSGDFEIERVQGEVAGLEVDVQSDVGIRGDRIEVRMLRARAGDAELRAEGVVDQEWALDWAVEVPDFKTFAAFIGESEGTLQAEGQVTGEREAPRVLASLRGDSLWTEEIAARRIEATLDVDLSDTRLSTVELHVEEAQAAFLASAVDLDLEGFGTTTDHTVLLSVSPVDGGPMTMRLEGGMVADDRWEGALAHMALAPVDLDRWVLREATPLSAGPDEISLALACLQSDVGREACVEGEWQPDAGARASVAADDFPLQLISRWLPDLDVEGELALRAEAVLPPDQEPWVEATADAGPGTLSYAPAATDVVVREYEAFSARVELGEGALAADLLLRFTDDEYLEGEVRATAGETPGEQFLSGQLRGEVHDRGLAGLLVPELNRTEGRIVVDLAPTGSLAEPGVTGSIALRGGAGGIIPLGVRLEEVDVDVAASDPATWDVFAMARSGPGDVTVEGRMNLPSLADADEATGDFSVQGERFLAYSTELARVVATPRLEVALTPGRLDVTGEVRIPEADIHPRDLEAQVVASPDVTIIRGEELTPEPEEGPLDLHVQVRVVMGEEVLLDAFGLEGRLEGALVVEMLPEQDPVGRGELQVVEGEYTAFRQTLEIDRARLLYADGPLANPSLDVRVTRETGDVLAGMNITGTAEEPVADLFSEPSMPEADVLSYLVLGRPASFAGEEEGDALGRAATALGVAGAQQVADRLGAGVLGLDEARIEAEEGEGLEQASLVLGTYLSPRLWVGYGIGLFEATNVLRVRYQIGSNWLLQTESGVHTGADVIYTIERR